MGGRQVNLASSLFFLHYSPSAFSSSKDSANDDSVFKSAPCGGKDEVGLERGKD
jgi:hypothetical protein